MILQSFFKRFLSRFCSSLQWSQTMPPWAEGNMFLTFRRASAPCGKDPCIAWHWLPVPVPSNNDGLFATFLFCLEFWSNLELWCFQSIGYLVKNLVSSGTCIVYGSPEPATGHQPAGRLGTPVNPAITRAAMWNSSAGWKYLSYWNIIKPSAEWKILR